MNSISNQLAARDQAMMQAALREAASAYDAGEVPVGAVVTSESGLVLGTGGNRTRRAGTVNAHAELVAIEAAALQTGDFRLDDACIYVTLEPCLMCLGAIQQARIRRVVFGAPEPKFGALGSRFDLRSHEAFRKLEFQGGVMAEECAALMSSFFMNIRNRPD